MDHILRFSYEPEDRELFVTVHLAPLPFRKRVWNAIRYVFGRRSRYGDHDEVVVNDDDVFRLLELLTRCGKDMIDDIKKSRE
jgi:hypothetical protein